MLYSGIVSGQYIVTAHPPSLRHVLEGLCGKHGPRTALVRRVIVAACAVALVLPGLVPAADSPESSSDGAPSGMGLVLAQVCDEVPVGVEGAFADAVTGLVTVGALTTLQQRRKRATSLRLHVCVVRMCLTLDCGCR